MKNIFTEHPNEQNESYLEHACFASKCGIRLIFLGIAAIIHALFPFVFQKTVSTQLCELNSSLETRS
tara:strand:+ start:232 stop:432 length:201 start_codon:yes stop_codon:yes gene_type:complete